MHLFKKYSFLTPVIWLLSWVSLFGDISSELLYPVLPIYLKSIGYSFLYIGLLEGFADATAGLTKGYFGKMSDKLQQRVVFIRTGYGFSTIGKALLVVTQQFTGIFAARFMDRLGKGIRTSSRDAMLASETTKENLAAVFGFHRAMDTTGAAIGPIAAMVMLHYFPGRYQLIFMVAIIPALVTVWLTFVLKREKKQEIIYIEDKKVPGFFSYFGYWKESSVQYRSMVLPLLLFALVNSADVFLLLRIKAAGFSDILMIGCYVGYNMLYALLSFPVGILADKIGRKTVFCMGLLLFAITYFGFSQADSLWQFSILFFIYALFSACNESVAKALLASRCEEKDRATALGFYESGRSIALLFASTWTGYLWSIGNASAAFIISAATTLIAMMIVWKVDKVKKIT